MGLVMHSTLAIYYVKYSLGREERITQFVTLGRLVNILGCALAVYLAQIYVQSQNLPRSATDLCDS